MAPRRASTLAELIVSLTMGAFLLGVAFGALHQVRRTVEGLVRRTEGERLGTEVIGVLEALGRHLRYPVVFGDTLLQAEQRLLSGVVCRVEPWALTLAPTLTGSPNALTFMSERPAVGDMVEVHPAPTLDEPGGWEGASITAVETLSSLDGCGEGSLLIAPDQKLLPTLRLTIDRLLHVGIGVPLEVFRAVRIRAYQSSDHRWSVGWTACGGGRCAPWQPVVGPVRSLRAGGLRLAFASGGAVRIEVRVPPTEDRFLGVLRGIDVAR